MNTEVTEEKKQALVQLLSISKDEVKYNEDNEFEANDKEYLILTDEEADEEWDLALENYLEEIIYAEIPSSVRCYFDEDRWKEDAKGDGRGCSIASYDGIEHEEEVNNTTYYIYRIS